MSYLLKISYDGKNYYGFAKQPNVPTVRETFEDAVYKLFNKRISVYSSSRTDRYVHAISMPIFIKTDISFPLDEIKNKLNNFLPKDIRVNEIEMIDNTFQVRYDAKFKKYRFLIDLSCKRNQNYYHYHCYKFDLNKFKENSKKFIGTKNFASFTGKESYMDYTRTINEIEISLKDDLVIFEIIGEGFMRYMVRNIVGALLANNRGKLSDLELQDWLDNPIKGKAHYKARGSALYLVEVIY